MASASPSRATSAAVCVYIYIYRRIGACKVNMHPERQRGCECASAVYFNSERGLHGIENLYPQKECEKNFQDETRASQDMSEKNIHQ